MRAVVDHIEDTSRRAQRERSGPGIRKVCRHQQPRLERLQFYTPFALLGGGALGLLSWSALGGRDPLGRARATPVAMRPVRDARQGAPKYSAQQSVQQGHLERMV